MKTIIITKVALSSAEIFEIKKYLTEDVTIINSTAVFMVRRINGALFGDFNWMRSLFLEPCDNRIFVTTQADLLARGITEHIASADTTDGDGANDVYIGLEPKLDARAKKNGFKSNIAWEIVHELIHLLEEKNGNHYGYGDRTHSDEMKGDLKVLYIEEMVVIPRLIEQKNSLVQSLIELLTTKVTSLLQQKKDMVDKKQLYAVALKYIGTDASPADIAPDELSCAETITTILREYGVAMPIITGTSSFKEYMDNSSLFKRVLIPKENTIIVCPTAKGHPFVGHTGIFLDDNRIMSTGGGGIFRQNYDFTSWKMRWVDKGGYQVYLYDII